jgi:hypothetical protein
LRACHVLDGKSEWGNNFQEGRRSPVETLARQRTVRQMAVSFPVVVPRKGSVGFPNTPEDPIAKPVLSGRVHTVTSGALVNQSGDHPGHPENPNPTFATLPGTPPEIPRQRDGR